MTPREAFSPAPRPSSEPPRRPIAGNTGASPASPPARPRARAARAGSRSGIACGSSWVSATPWTAIGSAKRARCYWRRCSGSRPRTRWRAPRSWGSRPRRFAGGHAASSARIRLSARPPDPIPLADDASARIRDRPRLRRRRDAAAFDLPLERPTKRSVLAPQLGDQGVRPFDASFAPHVLQPLAQQREPSAANGRARGLQAVGGAVQVPGVRRGGSLFDLPHQPRRVLQIESDHLQDDPRASPLLLEHAEVLEGYAVELEVLLDLLAPR